MSETNNNKKNYGFWNWGTGITITFIVAASFILFLVYKTTTVNLEMAEDNYYEQEMKFNNQLEASRNAAHLSSPIRIEDDKDFIRIQVPRECVEQKATGTLWIYRPSSEKNDLHLKFEPDEEGHIYIGKDNLITGVYKLKADWVMNGISYHQEEGFYLQKN